MCCSLILLHAERKQMFCFVLPLLEPVQHLVFLPQIIYRGVLHARVQTTLQTCRVQHSYERQGFLLSCRCQAFLRGLLGAIPVTSSGVNPLEDPYQLHVMFVFSSQFRQLPHRHLNTLLNSTLEGHFYLKH